jgi:hypothetical protein
LVGWYVGGGLLRWMGEWVDKNVGK